MHKFKIKYKDNQGYIQTASIAAENKTEAALRLIDTDTIISVRDMGVIFEPTKSSYTIFRWQRLSYRELADILRQFAYTKQAGLSLTVCLNAMVVSGNQKQVLFCSKVLKLVQAGYSLADAIQEHEYMLPTKISAIIRASSDAGTLHEVLVDLANQIEQTISITGKIRTAMIYPTIVLILAVAVTYFLFVTIIPQVAEVLQSIGGASLPDATLFILGIGEVLKSYGWYILFAILALIAFMNFRIIKTGSNVHSRFILHIPYVGKIVKAGELSKFYSHFAFLLQAGFVTGDATLAACEVLGNKYIRDKLARVYKAVLKGYSFADAMRYGNISDEMQLQLLQTGVASGTLADVCTTLSKQLAEESDRRTQNLLKVLEPTIMLIIGLIVGVIMIAVYQPLFEMMSVI